MNIAAAPAAEHGSTAPQARPRGRAALRWLRRLLPVVVLAAGIGFAIRQRLFVPIPVVASRIDRGDLVEEVFGRGTLESRNEVGLAFDLVGRVQELLVDEGDSVEPGQVLARLDRGQVSAERRAAQSSVSVARAALARLDAERRKADAALAFATLDAERIGTLQSGGAVAQSELDAALTRLDQARAEVEQNHASRAQAQDEIAAAATNVDVQSATVSRSTLVAPFAGQVFRRLKNPGDTASVGSTVLRLFAHDSVRARAWIDDSALPRMDVGQRARLRLGAAGEPSIMGTVDRIGRETDRQTHEIWVEIKLDALPKRYALGQRADVWIEVEHPRDVLRIRSNFVKWEGTQAYCYVARGGRIQRADLTLKRRGSGFEEVESGLEAGELVLDSPSPGGVLAEGRRFVEQP